jgi:hypothetical protein
VKPVWLGKTPTRPCFITHVKEAFRAALSAPVSGGSELKPEDLEKSVKFGANGLAVELTMGQ